MVSYKMSSVIFTVFNFGICFLICRATDLETEHTVCKIVTDKFVATAQSSVSRALKHLSCNSTGTDARIEQLEFKLQLELSIIKTTVSNIEKILSSQLLSNDITNAYSKRLITENCDCSKDVELIKIRENEIRKFNGTSHIDSNGNMIFTYYWKVPIYFVPFTNRSSSFYIYQHGYHMYLRIFTHPETGQLKISIGVTAGNFDMFLRWPFDLQHRISVLDQKSERNMEDIVSYIRNPKLQCTENDWKTPSKDQDYECNVIALKTTTLFSGKYVKDHDIIVKYTVFI